MKGDTLAVLQVEHSFVGGEDSHSRKREAQRVNVGRKDAEPVDDEERRRDEMFEDGGEVVRDGFGAGRDASEGDKHLFPEALMLALKKPAPSRISRERANVQRESDEASENVVDSPRPSRELRQSAQEIPTYPRNRRPINFSGRRPPAGDKTPPAALLEQVIPSATGGRDSSRRCQSESSASPSPPKIYK